MDDTLRSELLGTAVPTAVALAAVLLTIFRRPVATRYSERRRATTIFAILVALQAVHFLEEYGTGFHEQFPQVLRLVPWPSDFFVVFNVTWLALGTAAVIGLAAGYRLAFVPAWFFALAGIANGIGHPLLAVLSGGYFPGLVTSPLVGIAGVLVWRSLSAITEAEETWPRVRGILLFFETIVFTVLVPGTVTVLIPRNVLGIWGDTFPDPWTLWHVAALVPLTAGLAVYVRCVWEFAVRGRGIPAPLDHPKQLVVTGLYRYVRNPMYFGVMFFMFGQALFFRSLAFLEFTIAWFAFVHLNILVYEEPNLRRKFGDSYRRYTASVGRWIPGRPYQSG